MPARFNAHLRGLLGLLQAKVEGRTPDQFEQSLRGTFDSWPFLFANQAESLRLVTVGSGVEGIFTQAAAPPGEIWLVEHCMWRLANGTGANGTLAAAEELGAAMTLMTSNGGFLHLLGDAGQVFLAGSIPVGYASRPFVLMPGDTLGWQLWRAVTAGNFVAWIDLRFVRCAI